MNNHWLTMVSRASVSSLLLAAFMGGAAYAGKANDTLVFVREDDIAIADPYYANNVVTVIIGEEVCDNLLTRDPVTRDYVPNLATSYRWVDDKTLELKLREGVTFHNGAPFSAKDVKYTLDHVSAPDSGVIQRQIVDWIKSTDIIDDTTIRINAKSATPMALEYLSVMLYMLPSGHYDNAPVVEGRKQYGNVPLVCTGPYKITSVKPGVGVDMVANEQYFEGPKPRAAIRNLQYRTMPDRDAQVIELLGGNVSWVWDVQRDMAKQLAATPGVQVKEMPILRFAYMGFDVAGRGGSNPFQDRRVREAVAYAVDAGQIAKSFIADSAQLISSACHPLQFGCFAGVERLAYDPGKARELLKEAGYPNGFAIDLFAYSHPQAVEAIKNYLSAVGINANIRVMQYNALRPLLRSGEAKLSFLTWGSNRFNDATASTGYFFTHSEDDSTRDTEVKAELDIAASTVDPEVRKAAFEKALKRISAETFWVPMFTISVSYGAVEELEFQPYFDDIPRFYRARWK